MSVANVYNVPTNDQQLSQGSFLHMALHRDQILAVKRAFNVILPEYVIDPIDLRPDGIWFQQHQQMHDNIDQVLNVEQFNLIDVDWTNEASRIGWIQGHAQLHQQEAETLGVFS